MKKNNFKKGYTLLFAVLVSALTLAIGLSVLNISKKEFILASTARDSSYAFYAADSGLECAWYYIFDNNSNAFNIAKDAINTNTIKCGESLVNVVGVISYDDYYVNLPTSYDSDSPGVVTFSAKFGNTGACAYVQVIKSYKSSNNQWKSYHRIESRGYNLGWSSTNNTCDPTLNDNSTPTVKRIERAIRVTY